jgi:hypothetical protein
MVRCAACIALGVIFASGAAVAQIFPPPPDSTESLRGLYDASQISNEIFLQTSEDAFGEQLQFISDDLERQAMHPLDLKTATWQDLQQVPTLTDLDIFRILQNRKDGIPVSRNIINSERILIGKATAASHQNILLRTSVSADPNASQESVYKDGTYLGSPLKTVSRLVAKNEDFLFSLVEAKNPGEAMYFDHLTGCFATMHSLAITDDVSLSKLVIGDYSLSYGNGLLFSSGYGQLSTKKVTLNAAPRSSGIQPYISSSSLKFFRGAAADMTAGIFSASGFFSDRKIDATLDSSGKTILSFPSSAIHRTAAEIARKNEAQANVAGGHIAITPLQEDNYLEFGATAYTLNYDKPVAAKDSVSTGFSGQKHSMLSLETRSAFSKISLSGEFARMFSDAGYGNAFVMTLLGAPMKWLELSLNYRKLPDKFISPFGSTFGINSASAQNETGWYLGTKVTAIPNALTFFGSANIAESASPGNSPMHNSDIILGSEFAPRSFPVSLSFQFRSYGKGPVFSIAGDSLAKNSFRLDVSADLGKTISLSLRAELQHSYSVADSTTKVGHIVEVGIYYLPLPEFSVSSGIAFHETDSYSSRLYSNEADLPGSASYIPLYGSGFRYYLQFAYDIGTALTLSARIAQTQSTPTPTSAEVHKTILSAQFDLAF